MMYFSPETISFPYTEPDFFTSLVGVLSLLMTFLAMSFTKEGSEEESDGHRKIDTEALNRRIPELEALSDLSPEQAGELAELYLIRATMILDEADDFDEIIEPLQKAETVLVKALDGNENDGLQYQLGNLYLNRAVIYNDFDELDEALEYYGKAIEAFKPLDEKGDGEAKYDIAGIQLNRGTIYHEVGEFELARKDLDESFMAFRAVEKISDQDTRYYMAKVSVAQGSLLRDMGEPLEKIVDAYNRAMRLFVELIDLGQMEHERELANVLLDRCTATYEDYMGRDFESETERLNKFGDVLVDVGRGIEILERLAAGGDSEVRVDLFNALTTEGAMLLDIEKYEEALKIFSRAVSDFADFNEDTDPIVLNQYAGAFENRGVCLLNLDRLDEALADFDEAIRLRESIVASEFGLDEDAKFLFLPTLATTYANRANAYSSREDFEKAKADGQKGLELIRSLKGDADEDLQEIEKLFESLLDQWK